MWNEWALAMEHLAELRAEAQEAQRVAALLDPDRTSRRRAAWLRGRRARWWEALLRVAVTRRVTGARA